MVDRDFCQGRNEWGQYMVVMQGPGMAQANFLDLDEHMENVRREAENQIYHEIERVERANCYSLPVARAVIRYRLLTQQEVISAGDSISNDSFSVIISGTQHRLNLPCLPVLSIVAASSLVRKRQHISPSLAWAYFGFRHVLWFRGIFRKQMT